MKQPHSFWLSLKGSMLEMFERNAPFIGGGKVGYTCRVTVCTCGCEFCG